MEHLINTAANPMLLSRGELAGVAGAVFPRFLAPEPAARLDQEPSDDGIQGERANFAGLVLCCIEAKFYK